MKQKLRSEKLLRRLKTCAPIICTTGDPNVLLLDFEGQRKVKCERHMIADWLARGLIELKSDTGLQRANLTLDGQRFLARQSGGELADQHREIKHESIIVDEQRTLVRRNIKESPLSFLYRQAGDGSEGWLNSEEFEAGERIRADFEFAQMTPKITASWDPTSNLGSKKGGRRPNESATDRSIAAKKRLNDAVSAVGPELSGVVLDICCFLKGLEQVEREKRWPRRSAKLLLKAGLAALARHYGHDTSSAVGKTIRHWGGDGYRPTI